MRIKLAIILGSGIEIDNRKVTNVQVLHEVKDSGVHRKVIYNCKFCGHDILVIKGRKHFYEGHDHAQLLENVGFAEENHAENLIITNAAGGVNENFCVSELMLIKSHINLNCTLVYEHNSFPYDKNLSELFAQACSKARVTLYEGIYAYYQGPTYETRAEIRFQKKFHIDAAGMSTVPEITAAYSKGIRVIGVSVITNLLKENAPDPVTHDEVLVSAAMASANLNRALAQILELL